MANLSRPQLIDPRLLKALAHPTRIHIMDILSEGPNSPRGIQRRMGDISLNLLGHHMKVLKDLGCIELLEEVPRRGAREHIYKASERQYLRTEDWEAVEPADRPPVTATILRLVSEDVGVAFREGRFDEREDNHLSRSPLELDELGWSEVVQSLTGALEAVLEADVRSRERAEKSGTDLHPARVIIMQFPFGSEEPED
jgi:DNA-binding transcriptional ArsR family regulator